MALVKVSDLDSFRRLINTGAWFCVPKPVDDETLGRVFKRALIVLNQMLRQDKDNIEDFLASRLEICLERINGNEGFSLYNTVLSEVEKAIFSLVLKKTKGNKARAARLLGINRNTLTKKVKHYGL
jgi:Fis family transcriptional regulator